MIKVYKFFYYLFNKLYFSNTYKLLKKNTKKNHELHKIWLYEKEANYENVNKFEKLAGFTIDNSFFHKLAYLTQVTDKKSKISYAHGRLLYSSLRKYFKDNIVKNILILEVGTARGFSSLCMAKALEDSQIDGKIITLDILPLKKKIFWNCKSDLDGKKNRLNLLSEYLNLVKKYIIFIQFDTFSDYEKILAGRVNFAFIDGNHEAKNLRLELKLIKEYQEKGDIIFFDDYSAKIFPSLYDEINNFCDKFHYSKEIIKINESRSNLIATKI